MLNNPNFYNIEQMKAVGLWPQSHFSAYSMMPYIKRMKGDAITGIEVGVLKAENVHLLLSECSNITKLYGVDNYKPHTDYETVRSSSEMLQYEKIAEENTKVFGERYELIREDSNDAAKKLIGVSVDFILIDGDHTGSGVMSHLTDFYPLLKKGGIVFVHDYQMGLAEGLTRAVKTFREENKIRVPLNVSKNFIGFWVK